MPIKTIIASEIAVLDSDVHTGGGTDVTAQLQTALDTAVENGGVRLIMDGAALITGLRVHSNTTIECLTRDCGFFQKAGSNCALVTNADWDSYHLNTRNIILKGGTYNQDCLNQEHHLSDSERVRAARKMSEGLEIWTFGLEFYGVEHLEIRDLTVRNFRTFAVTIGGFAHVTIENVWLDLPDRMQAQNQDGFHFWGPGRHLTIRNVGGCVGDDFMNVGPDEIDHKSSITDVLIDGVYLEDADQAIRLLSRDQGRLDRVTIRNISGTYRSFGFYINPWFPEYTYGNFGDIFISNVNLQQTEPNYDYRKPMLFCIGGNIESIQIHNVRHHLPADDRTLFEVGLPFNYPEDCSPPEDKKPVLQNIIIDGLTIMENGQNATKADYIQVFEPVERLILKDITVIRRNGGRPDGHLLSFPRATGFVKDLVLNNISANGFKSLIDHEEQVGRQFSSNVVFSSSMLETLSKS